MIASQVKWGCLKAKQSLLPKLKKDLLNITMLLIFGFLCEAPPCNVAKIQFPSELAKVWHIQANKRWESEADFDKEAGKIPF